MAKEISKEKEDLKQAKEEGKVINEKAKKNLTKRAKKTVLIAVVASVMVILVGLLVLFAVLYNQNTNEQLYSERSDNMISVTDKISDVVDTYIDSSWNGVDVCETILKYGQKSDGTSFGSILNATTYMKDSAFKSLQAEDANYTVVLIDSNNQAYISGKSAPMAWQASYMTLASADSLFVDELNEKTAIFFVRKLAAPVNIYSKDVQLVVVALDVETLDSAFKLDAVNHGVTYLFGENGAVKCSYAVGSNYVGLSNVFSTLKDEGKIDDVEAIQQSIKDGATVCVSFDYQGTENYLAATKLSSNSDLYVATIVPTTEFAKDAAEFSKSSIMFYVEIAIIIAIMIACVVVLLLMAIKDRQIAVQQNVQSQKIEEIAQKAESASNSKIEFLENMSHDIRTPINGILGMTAIALREPNVPAKVEYCLFKIDTASHHLLSLVNDVLDMSHIESGKTEIVHEAMDIRQTINNCVNIIQGKLADRSLNFITEFDQFKHPHVYGDELHLRQILMNILGNAEKFTPDGGKIYFRVKEKFTSSNKLVYFFEIEDTGCGMKPDFLAHIFEPFTQEGEGGARTQYAGTGLGMSITKKYVDMMNGKIAVKSEVGVGTIFTVGIPFDADTSAHAETAQEVMPDFSQASPLDGVKVLLVEDNELNREVAQALLQDQGMHVSAAVNGQNAVFLFKNNPPGTYDVILMDIMMPVMDGLEATRQIRAMERPDAKKIPIIAMTANAFEEDVRKSYDAGMNEHLSKPIIMENLIKVLSKFVGK